MVDENTIEVTNKAEGKPTTVVREVLSSDGRSKVAHLLTTSSASASHRLHNVSRLEASIDQSDRVGDGARTDPAARSPFPEWRRPVQLAR